jgi:hypothetical protein
MARDPTPQRSATAAARVRGETSICGDLRVHVQSQVDAGRLAPRASADRVRQQVDLAA